MDIFGLIPTLGKAITGDIPGALDEGMKALGLKPTGDKNKDRVSFEQAIQKASPEQIEKLKALEVQWKIRDKELDVESEKVSAGDRDSARQREIAVKDCVPGIIGGIVFVGFFVLLGLLFFKDLPENNESILNIMIGSLATMSTGIISYYFGSSKGSQDKDDKIARMRY